MEQTAQPWAAVELLGSSSPPRSVEDLISLSEIRPRAQLKKSMQAIEGNQTSVVR
jgi:hypothetical protein